MKIVGIATRARITDYSLSYFLLYRQSDGHYGFFSLKFYTHYFFRVIYVFRIYVYTYRHSVNKEMKLLNFFCSKYFA